MSDTTAKMEAKAEKKTKFSLDTNPVGRGLESDIHLRIRTMSLDLSSPSHIPLSARIAEFSEDPQNMDQMKEFIDGILNDAEIEANKQLDEKAKAESKKNGKAVSLINGLKRGRMVTRAQTIIVRMFDTICNCTQQSAAALPGRVQTARSFSLTGRK